MEESERYEGSRHIPGIALKTESKSWRKLLYIPVYLFGAWLLYLFVSLILMAYFPDFVRSLPIQVFWGVPQIGGAETWAEAHPIWTPQIP